MLHKKNKSLDKCLKVRNIVVGSLIGIAVVFLGILLFAYQTTYAKLVESKKLLNEYSAFEQKLSSEIKEKAKI